MLAEISIFPVGRAHMGPPIGHVVDLIRSSGLPHQVTAMGTLVEGDDDAVWALLRRAHELAQAESGRVVTEIRLDVVSAGALERNASRFDEPLGVAAETEVGAEWP